MEILSQFLSIRTIVFFDWLIYKNQYLLTKSNARLKEISHVISSYFLAK